MLTFCAASSYYKLYPLTLFFHNFFYCQTVFFYFFFIDNTNDLNYLLIFLNYNKELKTQMDNIISNYENKLTHENKGNWN